MTICAPSWRCGPWRTRACRVSKPGCSPASRCSTPRCSRRRVWRRRRSCPLVRRRLNADPRGRLRPRLRRRRSPLPARARSTARTRGSRGTTRAHLGKRRPAPLVIPIGRRFERGALGDPVALAADLLPRHMAILAGSGSGKTVLLRRIVEEAALLEIPAIVLDINNDLSRLGDPWPTRPPEFSDEDAAKAAAYHARAEVVVWTPGVSSGNPLSLNLLPDFAAIGGGEDSQTEDDRASRGRDGAGDARALSRRNGPEGHAQARGPGRRVASLRQKAAARSTTSSACCRNFPSTPA